MTGQKDTEAINNLIIELAKANDWLSRDNLKERTSKPIKTLKEYLGNDIINLIDTKDFIELVNRNTGKGKTNIEKYKLKSGLDNLLTVFDYLKNEDDIIELMKTEYYKNHIPDIQDKLKGYVEECFKPELFNAIKQSPTAIKSILELNPEMIKKSPSTNDLKMLFPEFNNNQNEPIFNRLASNPKALFLSGLFFIATFERMEK